MNATIYNLLGEHIQLQTLTRAPSDTKPGTGATYHKALVVNETPSTLTITFPKRIKDRLVHELEDINKRYIVSLRVLN